MAQTNNDEWVLSYFVQDIYYFVLLLTQAWIKVAVNSTFKRYGQHVFIEALRHLDINTPISIKRKRKA